MEAAPPPALTYVVLAGDVDPEHPELEEFTAIITPRYLDPLMPVGDGSRSRLCTIDIDVLETNLAVVTAMLEAGGLTYEIYNSEPPNQTITIDFDLTWYWDAINQLRGLFSDIKFAPPMLFFALDGNLESRPDLLLTLEEDDGDQIITVRQNLSTADDEFVAPYGPDQWRRYVEALRTSGLLDPEAVVMDDPTNPEDHAEFYSVMGILTEHSPARLDYSLVKIINLFPRI